MTLTYFFISAFIHYYGNSSLKCSIFLLSKLFLLFAMVVFLQCKLHFVKYIKYVCWDLHQSFGHSALMHKCLCCDVVAYFLFFYQLVIQLVRISFFLEVCYEYGSFSIWVFFISLWFNQYILSDLYCFRSSFGFRISGPMASWVKYLYSSENLYSSLNFPAANCGL